MFEWYKLGRVFNPVDVAGRQWLHEFAQAPATLIFDDFVRVYFSCRSQRDKGGQFVSYSAFVDLDRKNLFNIIGVADDPVFALGEKGCFDEFGTYPMSIIEKDGQIWAYYAGWTRCQSVPFNTAIGLAISNNNGKTFDKLGPGPILSYSLDEPFIISGPKIRRFQDQYYLFYICGKKWIEVNGKPEMSLKIRLATSSDGVNWHKLNTNLIDEVNGENESQASPDVFYANGKYHMFFCNWIPDSFRDTKARSIGYASSNDLITWIRDDSKTGIGISAAGFDNEMVAYPHVFELDGSTYMLYLGNEVGRYGFGLARLEGELS